MNKILLIFIIAIVSISCSKNDENEIPDFEIGADAPFIVPILDWSRDTTYVKNNLPEGFSVTTSKVDETIVGDRYIKTSKLITLEKFDISFSGWMVIKYFFDENGKICVVENMIKTRTEDIDERATAIMIYSGWMNYFVKELGKPHNGKFGDVWWETKNIRIYMGQDSYSYITEFSNPMLTK